MPDRSDIRRGGQALAQKRVALNRNTRMPKCNYIFRIYRSEIEMRREVCRIGTLFRDAAALRRARQVLRSHIGFAHRSVACRQISIARSS